MRYNGFARENISYWTHRAPSYSLVNQEELRSSQSDVWAGVLSSRIRQQFGPHDPGDLKVLDVGTGPGFFAILLAQMGYQVTAVDYTGAMLEQARRNAGGLARRIQFLRMDAQQLTFPDGHFHVLLSRNLTWNLQSPHQAYQQWVRVLRKGGLLLNFDANWYRYLEDEEARRLHCQDRENVARACAEDDTAGTDVPAMESIARQVPLTACCRPAWDLKVLGALGMTVQAEEGIWRQVWTETERINNASTPMFLVQGTKNG